MAPFKRMLSHKAMTRGGVRLDVNGAYPSQVRTCCGVLPERRLNGIADLLNKKMDLRRLRSGASPRRRRCKERPPFQAGGARRLSPGLKMLASSGIRAAQPRSTMGVTAMEKIRRGDCLEGNMQIRVGRYVCTLSIDDDGERNAKWLPRRPKYLNKDERVQYHTGRIAFLKHANRRSVVDVVDRLSGIESRNVCPNRNRSPP
jgi:hypothetical protein